MFKKFNEMVRDKRGLTLIELLAVMAILAILAAIIAPSVSGQGEVGRQTQSQGDAGSIDSAIIDYFQAQSTDVQATEEVELTATVNGSAVASTAQLTSELWPEKFIAASTGATSTGIYANEFPTSGSDSNGTVTNVKLTDLDGTVITGEALLDDYTAVDFDTLEVGFILKVPESATSLSSDVFHNFLWLLRKTTSSTSSTEDDSRKLTVFRLSTVTVSDDASSSGTLPDFTDKVVTLTYEQVF